MSNLIIGTGLMLALGASLSLLVYRTRDHEHTYKSIQMRQKVRPGEEKHEHALNFLPRPRREAFPPRILKDSPFGILQSGQAEDAVVAFIGKGIQREDKDYQDFRGSPTSFDTNIVDIKYVKQRPRSSSLLDQELPSYFSTIRQSSSGVRPGISRRLSLSEKRELINVDDQILLVNLTRAHQTDQCGEQGQFYTAPPPRSSPIRLDSLSDFIKCYPAVDESIKWFRSPEGRSMGAEQSTISTTPRPQKHINRRPSQLSVSVNPDEIKEFRDLEGSSRLIIKTPRKLNCDLSEAYLTWRIKKSCLVSKASMRLDKDYWEDEKEDTPIESLKKFRGDLADIFNQDTPNDLF